MVQVRKLVLAIAAASALSSGMAHALGLGEMTLKSTLNQPLLVEIELQDVGGLSASDIVPSLASPQAFSDAGVNRQDFLNDLTFTPVLNPAGRSVVRVTSSKPLSEAYVRFLVQVQWPSGRLMRDYSVLLDPSKYAPAGDAGQSAPVVAPSAPVTAPTQVKQYTTGPKDTLWEIAAQERNGASVQQTMLAIQALNPDAFIDGNINRMKTGQVLRLPDPVQSTRLAPSKAIAEVAAQNAAWRQGRRSSHTGKQQVDASRRQGGEAAPAPGADKDNLSLVSAESAKKGGKGAAGDSKALSDKLAVTQESLDAARRDNAELKSRMDDLQSQLDKLQRLIQLKNDQLAKLQAQGTDVAPAAGQPAMPAELVAKPQVAPAPSEPSKPVQADVAPGKERKLDDLLSSPILLGLIAGSVVLVLLLLMLLLIRRRKAQQEAEKHQRMARALSEESDFAADLSLPQSSFEGLEVPAPSVKLTPAQAPAPIAERPTDVLGQAALHIERGHLNQAADLLEEAVKLEPRRSDLRLKLMEVYGRQGDRDGFVVQERQLIANGDNHAQVEQLKSRFPGMIATAAVAGLGAAAVAAELDEQFVQALLQDEPPAAVATPEPVVAQAPATAPVVEGFDSDFDLSLDDLEAASPSVVSAPVADLGLDDLQLDDDLSFESVLGQQTKASASSDDLLDFDLDLGGNEPAPIEAHEDFLLGLTDDPLAPQGALPALDALDELGLADDFDLSLADESAVDTGSNAFTDELDDVNAELERLSQGLEQPSPVAPTSTVDKAALGNDEPEFDFLSGADEAATKLDLAQAYIDMDDKDGARDILAEVLSEGSEVQKNQAREMLNRLT
ncbi:FimV/HubP family polar landmark protein [Pseudomonas agarici]|uniref:FimV/HubP family polar landmark protein n=1 Tax=Pseudomonas agarici TaxID=46677 RepID=UPI0002EE1191|nr:FimV/HubP family polar landmark protein [Pseudomonas agarici]NWB89968.1 FimV family protein [Pseudomonas agarici]NWC08251.1 FimV family protein [Pseudomonas agarici]SEK82767.1 pilus assembly protein FimV [Pseudomonas agarici]